MNDDKLANHWVELFVLWKQSTDPSQDWPFFFLSNLIGNGLNCDLV